MATQQDYLKFKKILEVYCKHAEYISDCANRDKSKSPSKNFRESNNTRQNSEDFSKLYNLDNATWNEIAPDIYVDMHFLNPHNGGDYNRESFSYMNLVQGRGEGFDGTWINIVPKFEQQRHVIGFKTGYSEKALKNTDDIARSLAAEYPVSTSPLITTQQLGLFDGSDKPTKELQALYNKIMEIWGKRQTLIRQEKDRNHDMTPFENTVKNALEESRNLILHGAPGTGKTHTAQIVAAAITGIDMGALPNSEQFSFVQFHPSYDYTDFVEGLRPTLTDDDSIGFELRDGVFKAFVDLARTENLEQMQADISADHPEIPISHEQYELLFDKALNELIEYIQSAETEEISIPLATASKQLTLRVGMDSKGNPRLMRVGVSNGSLLRRNLWQLYKDDEALPHHGNRIYMRAVINYLKQHYNLPDYAPNAPLNDSPSSKKYVFVIDEINRGDISKIFGELFFAIDPSYRGPKGGVQTQYSNMHDNPTDKFYIPENVYIIGTMNDIDRNVDTFDFAMRRRFRFMPVAVADTQETILATIEDENTRNKRKERMNGLNAIIATRLGDEYQIGASYFTHNVDDGTLWSQYIEPLLLEYLRGNPQKTEIMQDFTNSWEQAGPQESAKEVETTQTE